ncbi:MAG: shikimate dehydrogenase [Eggerthellaceae bacterium]|nr:shikimate dehydrogenase [Eggerthellaceae bacterium]
MEPTPLTNGATHLLCLIGSPVEHSASPAIHTLSFQKLGINAVYLAFDVQPEQVGDVIDALRIMKGWDGANVTMPCKQAVIPYLDGLSPAAELMGAVNVLNKEADGRITGHNTDGAGFMTNLRKHGIQTDGARMALLGPGGAGSAILVQAALDGMARLDVFARAGGRSYRHAQELIASVSQRTACDIALHDMADREAFRTTIAASDILVNATNVGMGENCTDTPIPADFIRPGMAVADAIYLPRETQLIRDAQACGCTTIPGLGMLLEQAAESERIWYGANMPTDEIARELFG